MRVTVIPVSILLAGAGVLSLLAGPAAAQGRPGGEAGAPVAAAEKLPMLEAGAFAPAFRLPDVFGEEFAYGGEGRKKPLLLAFFSVFCAPCRAQLPVLEKVREKYGEAAVDVACVSLDGDALRTTVEGFAKQDGYTFRVLLDQVDEGRAFRVAESYRVTEIPTLYLADAEGRIAFARRGRVAEEDLGRALKAVLRK